MLVAALGAPCVAHAQTASSSPPPASTGSASPDQAPPAASSPTPAETAQSPAPSPAPAPPPGPEAAVSPAPSSPAPASPPPPSASAAPAIAPSSSPAPLDASAAAAVGATTNALSELPGSTTVIADREIFRVQPLTESEMVRRIPGLYAVDIDGEGLWLNAAARGFDPTRSRYLTVLEDGIPISLAPYGDNDVEYVPPVEQVERIESVRGAGSVIYGPNSLGGVLNFVTAAPPRAETWSLRAFGGLPGTYGAQAMYGTPFDGGSFIATLTRRQGDGLRSNAWEQTDLLSKFRLVTGPRSELLVRLGATDQGAALTTTGLTQPMFQSDAVQNPTPYDWYRLRRFTASITHDYRIADDIRLRTLLYGAITDRTWYRQLFDRTPAPDMAYVHIFGPEATAGDSLYFRDATRIDTGEYQFFGLEPRLQAGFRLSGFRNELDLGARVLAERATESVALGDAQYARSGNAVHAEQREGVGVAAYLQDRVYFTDALRATAGVRVESYSASRLFRRDAGQDLSLSANAGYTGVIPGGAISYATQNVTTWAGIHLGWAPPHTAQSLDPYKPMWYVQPEQSINYEIGARAEIGSWLRAEAAAFYIDFQTPIVYEALPTGTFGFTNDNPRRHIGAEGMVSANFGRLAELSSDIFLSARYMFVDARYDAGPFNGNVAPYVPAHTLVASAGFANPLGITASLSWLYVSDQFADPANTQVPSVDGRVGIVPAYNVVDFAASYTHRDTGLGLAVTAKNALGYPLGGAYIATRSPDGVIPSGFAEILVTARWDH